MPVGGSSNERRQASLAWCGYNILSAMQCVYICVQCIQYFMKYTILYIAGLIRFKEITTIFYLHSGLCKVGFHGDFLSCVDVRIVRLRERLFQLFELGAGERRPDPSLFTFLWTDGRGVVRVLLVHFIRQTRRRTRIT